MEDPEKMEKRLRAPRKLRPFKVCDQSRRRKFGVAARYLHELKTEVM